MSAYSAAEIEIQPVAVDHAAGMLEAAAESVEETSPWMEWIQWCRPGITTEQVGKGIAYLAEQSARGEAYSFSVIHVPTHLFLGLVGIDRINRKDLYANLWYWIRTTWTGRGLAGAAARLAALYGFQVLGLQRIEIVVPLANTRSRRVAIKVGAIEEGIARNRCRHYGKQSDAFMFSLIPSDFGINSAA